MEMDVLRKQVCANVVFKWQSQIWSLIGIGGITNGVKMKGGGSAKKGRKAPGCSVPNRPVRPSWGQDRTDRRRQSVFFRVHGRTMENEIGPDALQGPAGPGGISYFQKLQVINFIAQNFLPRSVGKQSHQGMSRYFLLSLIQEAFSRIRVLHTFHLTVSIPLGALQYQDKSFRPMPFLHQMCPSSPPSLIAQCP